MDKIEVRNMYLICSFWNGQVRSWINVIIWKYGPSPVSFSFSFCLFRTRYTISTTNNIKNYQFYIRCWDSNSQSLHYESPILTTTQMVDAAWAIPRLFFAYLFFQAILQNKNCRHSWIWTRIAGVECDHTDHLTTTSPRCQIFMSSFLRLPSMLLVWTFPRATRSLHGHARHRSNAVQTYLPWKRANFGVLPFWEIARIVESVGAVVRTNQSFDVGTFRRWTTGTNTIKLVLPLN